MKKQYLLCSALLLSAPYIQYTSAMQGQHSAPAQQAVQVEQCPICYDDMAYDNAHDPRERLICGHKFHRRCLVPWYQANHNHTCPMCRGAFQPIPDYPDPVVQPVQPARAVQAVNQAQPVLPQVQPEQRAEQRRVLTPAEQIVINQIADNLESYPNFVQCLHDAGLLEQFLGQAQEQEMPVAQQEQPRLTPVEHEMVTQLAQELAPLERDDIDAVLFEAYTNPGVLVQSNALRRELNDQQEQLIDDLLLLYTQRMSEQ